MRENGEPSRGDRGQSRSAAGEHNPWLIALVVSIATFMLVLDTSIANVALRNIAGSLAAGIDESTWIITTYLVANAVVLPISGWLSSVIGRKRFYMLCVALFTASSLMCGLSTGLPMLIFFRILQGLGGGGMAPSEQAILADTFPPEKRAQAFALYGVAVIVAPTIGPTLGGWLTDNFSWHWIFFINVPIGVISLLLVHWLLVEPEALKRERRERFRGDLHIDYVGFALVALWLGSLEIVLDKGQQDDWLQSNFILVFSLVSLVSALIFFPWEFTRKDPIVDVRLLFQRNFGVSFLVMGAVGAVLFGTTQILPQLLQTSYGYTALLSGYVLMPGGVAMLMCMPIAGQVARFVQPRYLIAGGMAVVALAMWQMSSLAPNAGFHYFVWNRVFQVVALPFLFIPINTAAYAGLAPERTNQASALINVARNLGGSVGVSLANTIIARQSQAHQALLVGDVSPTSLAYQRSLANAAGYLTSRGTPPSDAQHQAIDLFGRVVQQQAQLLAYIDLFRDYAVLAAAVVALAFALRRVDLSHRAHAH
ncbi:MAG TPA: DHA2 family efflux MFS transporter permease subunit [Beijerinckiaceae bacterium]|nr:DHA2 family efflux MFS transporter permease subunit [Beijerinckiaceae bacterium]